MSKLSRTITQTDFEEDNVEKKIKPKKPKKFKPNFNVLRRQFRDHKVITLFSNKGGVGKTTLTYNIARVILDEYHCKTNIKKILLVDCDPQMNLTSVYLSKDEFKEHINNQKDILKKIKENDRGPVSNNSMIGLYANKILNGDNSGAKFRSVFSSGNKRINLLLGSLDLSRWDQQLSLALLQNGASMEYNYLIDTVSKFKQDHDLVIIDLNGTLSSLNKCLMSQCDSIFSPLESDDFSRSSFNLLNLTFYQERALNKPKLCGFILNKVSVIHGVPTNDEEAGKNGHLKEIENINSQYINPETTVYLGHIERFTTEEQQMKMNVIERLGNLSRHPGELSDKQPSRRKQAIYHQFVTVTQKLLGQISDQRP